MAEPLACAVLGMRRLGPVSGDPVVVTGAGTMGLLPQLLLLARGRSCCCPGQGRRAAGGRPASWALPRPSPTPARSTGHAWRSRSMPRGCRRRSRSRRAARPWRAGGGLRCVARPRPRSASRRAGFIPAKSSSPGRWLSCAASARPDGGYRTAAASPACWPGSGTSRSDQHFITCSSHLPGLPLRSVTDLGVPPAMEAISMPDSSPGIQAQVGPDCAAAGWRSRSRPGL